MAKRKKSESLLIRTGAIVLGCLLAGLTLFLAISLLSYDPNDTGYNIASSREVKNILGAVGAFWADWAITWLGLALPVFMISWLVWSFELIRYRILLKKWWRMTAWIIGCLSTTVFFDIIIKIQDGFAAGGKLGEFFRQNLLVLGARLSKFNYNLEILATITGILSIVSFNFACGITFTDWYRFARKIILAVWSIIVWLCATSKKVYQKTSHVRSSYKDKSLTKAKGKSRKEPKFSSSSEAEVKEGENYIQPAVKKESAPVIKKAVVGYNFPDIELLGLVKDKTAQQVNQKELEKIAVKLEEVLKEFGVIGKIVQIKSGPVVTLYELEPSPGTKIARVIGLSDDIARSMRAVSVRIAVVPGSNTIGIEMPNPKRETVYLRDLIDADEFRNSKAALTISLGKDIGGKNTYADLAKMPHLLVAGTTGSGKSVGVNSMIISLLYKMTPEECKLIMIDPKMLEFTMYNGIPHLLTPVITDPAKAVIGLKWAVKEMEDRYRAMAQLNVRNITGYNQKLEELRARGEKITKTVQTGFDMETGKPIYEEQEFDLTPMPYIVIVVDEMADLMLVAGKEVEAAIQRLAQMARAAGIHLIMSTQRPSVDVITGTIKANFPTRISYQVTSKIDSRTILGEQGAEQLLGMGDMLYMPSGQRPRRIHAPFVKDSEVEKIVEFIKAQRQPEYIEEVTQGELETNKGSAIFDSTEMGSGSDDDLYRQAVQIVQTDKKASTSYVQRRLRIGYNRAASIIDRMEQEGIVSPADHVGRREVL